MSESRFPLKFHGKKSQTKYVIDYVTNEYREDVVNGMINYFLTEEPICKNLKTYEDEHFIKELKIVWNSCMDEKKSLMCLTDENEPKFAGFLLLLEDYLNSPEAEIHNEKWEKLSNIVDYVRKKSDIGNTLKIKKFLTDYGLLVLPEFRGEGIAEKLLSSCSLVCKQHDLPATIMTFSSIKSQSLAKKLDWTELYSITFKELKEINKEKYGIENIDNDSKDIKDMYIIVK